MLAQQHDEELRRVISMQDKHNLYYCTPSEVTEWIDKVKLVIVPTGSVEQHGPFAPISTDCLTTELTVRRVAEAADVPYTPMIWAGYTPYHLWTPGAGKGTVTLRWGTYVNMMYDVARSLIHDGFDKVIFAVGHTGNLWPLDVVMRWVREETGALLAAFRVESEIFAHIKPLNDLFTDPPEKFPWKHAAEAEASAVMAYDEDLIDKGKLCEDHPHNPDWLPDSFDMGDGQPAQVHFRGLSKWNRASLVRIPTNFYEFSDTGMAGSGLNASKEKGEALYNKLTEIFVDFVNEVKKIKVSVRNRDFSVGKAQPF